MSNQLVKKNPAEGYQNVFPKTWIDAIKDKESGVSLQEILQGFNMYFLSYNGSRALTRCKVPSILRKEGLWITYVLYDHTVVTEWYNSDQIDDNSWSMDSNWRVASNSLVGDISVSADGYWVINGEKTEAKAQGEQGVTPLLRVGANSKLQASYNAGKAWKDISDYIIPRFRWNQGTGTTAGTIQISMDLGKTWTNLSNEITNNLRISRYIDINESLPTSGVAEGTIYMKGPYYDESDTSNANPIYRMWVYAWKGNTLAWQDNGEFTSISTGIVQERGNSTTEVMSQDSITRELTKLEEEVSQLGQEVTELDNGAEVLNVDLAYPLESGSYTLATAIAVIESKYRKKGKIITFHDGGRWQIYQFRDTDNIITDSIWKNVNSWVYYTRPRSVFVPASSGIDGINDVLWMNPSGVIIELEEGTYSSSKAVSFWNGGAVICSNAIIIGKGAKTIISRTSGNDVIQSNASSSNNIIKNVSFAHGYQRTSISGLKIYESFSNGKYVDDSIKSAYDIKIAASDSTAQAKENADFICSGSGDESVINSAINSLTSGGSIFLAAGTYILSSFINLKEKSNISIKGAGKNTVITRSSGYAIYAETATDCCISEVKISSIKASDSVYRYNVWINDVYNESTPNQNRTVRVYPEKGIEGINDAIYSMPDTGGTIELSEGTYTGNTFINFYKSTSPAGYKNNIRIVGIGKNTVIQRNTNASDLIANSTDVKGNIIENVSFAHSISRTGGGCPTEQVRLIACYINDEYVDESNESSSNIINIGVDRYYKKLSTVLNLFFRNGINPQKRWEIHIYGHIVETEYFGVTKNYIDIIGHNAIIEIRGGKNEFIRFLDDDSNDFYGPGLYITVKDIHFLKTGCYSYWDSPCVNVESDCVTFENCTFENATSNPYPFNQADYGVGYEDSHGGRRHGVEVYCSKYGKDCKTVFKNCVAIGSPFGTNSSRGFYLVFGSPKLYNCIGYGGGYGEFGHGIINHRASRAELFNCIGYASEHSYRQAAGIRFQACGSSQLIGCVGVPSYGEKLISNGVKASAISRICGELGLDESTYIVNDEVQFDAVAANTDICAKISNDDLDIVGLGESTEESYGFSFWANSGIARLINCKGYIGAGNNSRALHCIAKSEPTIIGGYYGLEDIMSNTYYIPDQGQNYMTFIPVENEYVPYKIRKVAVTVVGYSPANGDTLYLETVESTPQVIVDGFDMSGLSSIVNPTFNEVVVPAGVKLNAYVMNNGTIKQITSNTMIFHIASNYKPLNSSALYIAENSKPIIKGAILRGNNDAISIGQSVENIKVFDCLCEGEVDANITFAEKTAINGSSNYRID